MCRDGSPGAACVPSSALPSRAPDCPELGVHSRGGSRRNCRDDRVEDLEKARAFLLAELADAVGVVLDGLAHDLTLRLPGARGGPPQPLDRGIVERERDLYHTVAILPYPRDWRSDPNAWTEAVHFAVRIV